MSFAGAVKSFGAVRALDGIGLEIRRGETVALLGRNGAGKSTALSLPLGLDEPDEGRVLLFGDSPARAVRAGRVGAMLQDGRPVPRVTVRELVAFVASTYPGPMPVAEALDLAGLGEFGNRRVDKLSGGRTQRVRLAVALAGSPELVVPDEPTAALDVEARRAFWESMRAYVGRGNTVLFSTHYLEEADDNADRIVVVDRGRIVADDSGDRLRRAAGGSLVPFDVDVDVRGRPCPADGGAARMGGTGGRHRRRAAQWSGPLRDRGGQLARTRPCEDHWQRPRRKLRAARHRRRRRGPERAHRTPRGGRWHARRRPLRPRRLPGERRTARGHRPRTGTRTGAHPMIRVLLAEDQGMMRGALALLLGLEPDIEVVAQVSAGDEIVDAALMSRPDVALLDTELPGLSGLDAAALLRDQAPDCRVLILTTFGRPGYLRRAMESGAAGFLVKDGPVEELAVTIRRVLTGETVIDPVLAAAALSSGPSPLTARECDVLNAAVDGATVADIAGKLHLSESTVRNYLSSAIGKTGTRNRMEAVRAARQQGWL